MFSETFLILDFSIYFIRKHSLLGLRHEPGFSLGLMIAIPITAFLIGTLGFYLEVVQPTRSASIAIGLSWQFVLAALFGSKEGIASDETGSHNGKTKLNEEDPGNGGKVLK